MSKVQTLRVFVRQRLTAAAEEIFELFERTIAEYEEELCRQRKLLDAVFQPEVRLHRADVVQLFESEEEDPEWSSSADHNDPPELPHIKEEQDELWTDQEGEQLQGLEETDVPKFMSAPVAMESKEDDEKKPQSSQIDQTQTEEMKTEADGEDCAEPELDRNLNSDAHNKSSEFSGCKTINSELRPHLNFLSHDSGRRGERTNSCSVCGKQFSLSSNLRTHMRIHTGEKPFSCSFCCKRFTQKVTLKQHMALHTGEKRYCCNVCGNKFTWHYQLKNHRCIGRCSSQLHHSPTTEVRDAENLKTEADEEDFGGPEPDRNMNPDNLLQPAPHLAEHNTYPRCDWEEAGGPQSSSDSLQINKEAVSVELNSGETALSSSECETSCGLNEDQQNDDRAPTGVKLFTCSVCGKSYPRKKSFMAHVRLHSEGKRFSCSVCRKNFQRRADVERHMKIHTGERPFSCSVCGTRFGRKETLGEHMRIHTGEKPYRCSICGKGFTTESNMTRHVRVHTGEKPFTCSECKASFGDRSNFSKHMRIHAREKLPGCSVCGQRFGGRGILRQHSTVHIGETL